MVPNIQEQDYSFPVIVPDYSYVHVDTAFKQTVTSLYPFGSE